MRKIFLSVLMFLILGINSLAQQVSLTGKVINPDEKPVKKVLVYLANNPSLYCYSDTLGNFSLTNISTSVSEVMQDKIISFENRKLSIYAYNQSIAVDVFTIDGRQVKNIVNLRYCLGTFGLYPETYLSDLPKAIYIVRVIVGNTSQSFKIQNLIPTAFPQGITEYDINNIIDRYITESKSEPDKETKSETLDTLVLVHDFYKLRKIPIDSYITQYDTIHLNNFSDYSIAEGFEPAVTYLYSGYGEFTNILSEGNIQFIIDYDTLSTFNDDLKLITIPVGGIENLDNSIKFISGLHLEPSGTKFIQPVQVTVMLKDSIPKHLVVFQCDDQGKTHYLPYVTHALSSSRYYSVVFIINHFSSVGIGTGQINRDSDPSKFTTSEQFEAYAASYSPDFDELPPDFWSYWFNNIVAPKITGIVTWEDFKEAYRELAVIEGNWIRLGLDEWGNTPFSDQAKAMFCEKVLSLWNQCMAEYDRLDDYCLKREIYKTAANLFELSILTAGEGSFCPGFSLGNINDLGNGEIDILVNEIEFLKTVKHLELEGTYLIEYNLKTISGNPPIPEVISWSSSNPSIASVNADGRVFAVKPGVAVITGRICDITNTIKIEVGGVNCEKDYCENKFDSCYSGTYRCTGVLNYSYENYYHPDCPHRSTISRLTIVGGLTNREGYYEKISSTIGEEWDSDLKTCITTYGTFKDYVEGFFSCTEFSYYSDDKNFFQFYLDNFRPELFQGYLRKDKLTLNVELESGVIKASTAMHCVRIDK